MRDERPAQTSVNPIQEVSGAAAASLLTGLSVDEYFVRTDTGGASVLLTDGLGSTVALTNAAQAVQTQYTYEPFGATGTTGGASSSPFQFTGRENDGLAGLYYYRARYYHPQLQRFVSEDPIGFRGRDFNLFAYVRNNPLRFIDPLGLDYLDVNVSAGTPWFVGGTGGAMFQGGCVYPYVGGGLVTPGASPAVTWSPSSVTTGWNVGLQVNFGPAFQVGYSFGENGGFFWEVGGSMPPGASLTAYYVFDRVYCKPKAPAVSSKSSQ